MNHDVRLQDVVGGQYESIGSERIFILGESHYEEGEASPGFTKAVVAQHADGTSRHGFYTKIAQLLEACHAGEVDQEAFWEKVAFTNLRSERRAGAKIKADHRAVEDRASDSARLPRSFEA